MKARRFLEKSKRFLDMAWHDYEDGFYEGAISHAYYAMFHAAKAMLTSSGIATKTHKGTILKLAEYVESGRLSREEIKVMAHCFDLRMKCD